MIDRLRGRLTYANVMATIAVFGVLAGGGAYAASKIGANDIAKNAVRAKHIKKNQVKAKHVASNAVRTREIRDGAVTSAKLADGVAYARISHNSVGDILTIDRAKEIGPSNVTVENNAFCFKDLSFSPENVQATLGGPGVGFGDIIRATIGPNFCPAGTEAEVYIENAGGGGPFVGRTFMVLFN